MRLLEMLIQCIENKLFANKVSAKCLASYFPYAYGISASFIAQLDLPDMMTNLIMELFSSNRGVGLTLGAGVGVYFFPDTCEIASFGLTAGAITDFAYNEFKPEFNMGAGIAGGLGFEGAYYLGNGIRGEASADTFAGPFVTLSIMGSPVSLYVGLAEEEIRNLNNGLKDPRPPQINPNNRWYGGVLSPPPPLAGSLVAGAMVSTIYYSAPYLPIDLDKRFPLIGRCACATIAAGL